MKKFAFAALGGALSLVPMFSHAESTTTNPAVTNSTASARLDFTVVIPAVLYLRIGTGNAVAAANNATIDGLTFTVPGGNVGDSSVVAGTGGDLTNGAVTVRVFSNVGGNVSLNSSVLGPMNNGNVANTIAWSQISVASAALGSTTAGYTNTAITHPAFNTGAGGGSGTATTLSATAKLVRFEGKWTYTYLNATSPAGGSYGGVGTNNGRVTYTATAL